MRKDTPVVLPVLPVYCDLIHNFPCNKLTELTKLREERTELLVKLTELRRFLGETT